MTYRFIFTNISINLSKGIEKDRNGLGMVLIGLHAVRIKAKVLLAEHFYEPI